MDYLNMENATDLIMENSTFATHSNVSMTTVTVRATTMAIISFLAILGNLLVLVTIAKFEKLQTPANMFVANLAVSNLVTGTMLSLLTWNVVIDRNALGHVGCSVWAAIIGGAIVCSTFDMALVSINRYMLVAHTSIYPAVFTLPKTGLMCVGAWFIGIGTMLGSVTGWSKIQYNPKTKACSYQRNGYSSFHYFGIIIGFAVPLMIVIVCYTLLFITVCKSRRRVSGNTEIKLKVNNHEKRLTKMLVAILLIYIVCLGPYSFVNLIDSKGTRISENVTVLVTWLMFSNSALNPFIYGLMNQQFRNGYTALLKNKKNVSIE